MSEEKPGAEENGFAKERGEIVDSGRNNNDAGETKEKRKNSTSKLFAFTSQKKARSRFLNYCTRLLRNDK